MGGKKNRFFGDFWGSVAGALRVDLGPLSSAKFHHDSILKVVSGFLAPLGPNSTSPKTKKKSEKKIPGVKNSIFVDFWGSLVGALRADIDPSALPHHVLSSLLTPF